MKRKSINPLLRVVAIKVVNELLKEMLEWMTLEHIPNIKKTGCFFENRSSYLVDNTSLIGFSTLQFTHQFKGKKSSEIYKETFVHGLTENFSEKWKEDMTAGRVTVQYKATGRQMEMKEKRKRKKKEMTVAEA